jgi:uncharacterized protein
LSSLLLSSSRFIEGRLSVVEMHSVEERLLAWFKDVSSCAVALSGGVDSAVVAASAYRAVGDCALAFTAVSPSLAADELAWAERTASHVGIRHVAMPTDEHLREAYRRNGSDRCFHCKSTLYETARLRFGEETWLLNGANLDDLGDFRPGMQAATDFGVRSPLIECQIGKSDVRELAKHWGLEAWDKPASPCLSSRIAYGVEVTPERLAMVEAAECFLRESGFGPHRVRLHSGEMARLEIQPEDFSRLTDATDRGLLDSRLKAIGFRFVAVELASFESGSLNQLIALTLPPATQRP